MKSRVIVFAVGLAMLIGIWQRWPSDERRIRRLVGEVAGTFDGRAAAGDLERAARLAPLGRTLAPDVVVDGISPDGSLADAVLSGREAVIGAAAGALRLAPDLHVSVEDVVVTVLPRASQATAIAGIVVSSGGGSVGGWRDIREVQFELARHEDTWLVTRVTPIQTLRR
jgi:hypothetical protein